MSGRRVVLITRRFWPLVGEAETALANLAVGLRRAGTQIRVLTAQWQKNWPRHFHFEDVPVFRVPSPSKHWWGDWQFASRLAKWLRQERENIDVVLIASHGGDMRSAMSTLSRVGVPVVRLNVIEDTDDPSFAQQYPWPRPGRRRPDAFVVADTLSNNSESAVERIERVTYRIRPGVPIPPPPTGQHRREIRRALGKACGDRELGTLTPLAVYVGPLEADRNLASAITAWNHIIARRPDARLWLFGEGSQRKSLYELIEQCRLKERVALPGVMEHVEDLLTAADLFVAPGGETFVSPYLLSAMAAGLPVVASDTPAHRAIVTSNEHGLLYPADDPETAAAAIDRLLAQPTLANVLGKNARRRIMDNFALENHVAELQDLCGRLIEQTARA